MKHQTIKTSFLRAIEQQIDNCELLQQYKQYNQPGTSSEMRRWLLAVSGGPDSMALMYGLYQLAQAGEDKWDYLHIAHLNHNLRGQQSAQDADFVEQQARKLGLDVTIVSHNVAAVADELGVSIETAARKVRYSFLIETAYTHNCGVITTGHNADDNVETILHRIIRGTGLKGLAGIPGCRLLSKKETLPNPPVNQYEHNEQKKLNKHNEHNIILLRPLLSTTRKQIEDFLKQQQISYRTDQSNFSLDYTRNKLRHELLTLLRESYNPNINIALTQLGQIARQANQWLKYQANQLLPSLITYPPAFNTAVTLPKTDADANTDTLYSHVVLDAQLLASQADILQAQIIQHVLSQLMGIPQQRLGYKHIQAIITILKATSAANQSRNSNNNKAHLLLPYGLRINLQAGRLTFAKDINKSKLTTRQSAPTHQANNTKTKLAIPGTTKLPSYYMPAKPNTEPDATMYSTTDNCRISITTEIIIPGHNKHSQNITDIIEHFKTSKTRWEEMLDANALQGELYIRHIVPGDRFRPLGSSGSKKLGDFFTDNKVPLKIRQYIPLLCDDKGIIWVVGLRIANRVKATPTTKRLLLIRSN